jgi:EAL domain-containing protein (putative c-di-GMP-specific phosphodiesterase class I)
MSRLHCPAPRESFRAGFVLEECVNHMKSTLRAGAVGAKRNCSFILRLAGAWHALAGRSSTGTSPIEPKASPALPIPSDTVTVGDAVPVVPGTASRDDLSSIDFDFADWGSGIDSREIPQTAIDVDAHEPLSLHERGEVETVASRPVVMDFGFDFFGGSVVTYMQPIVDLRSGETTAVECLARILMPNGDIISAAEFVPLLSVDQVADVFATALHEGLDALRLWDHAGIFVAATINLDPRILNAECVARVRGSLSQHGIKAHRLILEVLETHAVESAEQRDAIQQLRSLGVRLAMDDLGSGLSTLRRLAELPFDMIKIDGEFTTLREPNPVGMMKILSAVINLGLGLGHDVVVEGIEDAAMMETAAVLGATHGQGYHIAKPMPIAEIPAWIEQSGSQSLMGVNTFLAALAQHLGHTISAFTPHPLEECWMTNFIALHAEFFPPGDWHAAQHGSAGTSTEDLTEGFTLVTGWLLEKLLTPQPGAIAPPANGE